VRWLTADEEQGWRAVASIIHKLGWAVGSQLERDSDLSFIEYHALARLSEEPDGTLRMSELAMVTNASLSRLSHLVTRLEEWGFVRREPDKTNGRFTNAILTEAGSAKLVASAPAHVAAVRQLVIDEFSATELDQLREFCERILARVDASTWKQPLV
jgi:DNA-binding MarR family transcriptional regulator